MIDLRFLDLAIRLGDRQLGRTGSNPSVGCVLVREGRVIGIGATGSGGRPHAETIALQMAGDARGADAYVTLEPCAHQGKTGPCANALVGAGVDRVICSWKDPDPRVAGRGFSILRDAGIEVLHPKMAELPAGLIPFFITKTLIRPHFTLKLATSLDGKIALGNKTSKWISSEQARKTTRAMRASFDGVLVGIGTILADDPQLDIRINGLTTYAPRPIILDRKLRTPAKARIWNGARPIIVHDGSETPIDHRADYIIADIKSMSSKLIEQGMNSVLIEGGREIVSSFLKSGLTDEIHHVTTSAIIGNEGLSAVGDLGHEAMETVSRMKATSRQTIGDDTLIKYRSNSLNVSDFSP